MNPISDFMANIDKRAVISSVTASVIIGVFAMIAIKSGIKPLKVAAKVVK